MKKYTLEITRTVTDIGYVTVDAENEEDAKRKYFYPDSTKGEEVIFDSEVDWNAYPDYTYSVEVFEDDD